MRAIFCYESEDKLQFVTKVTIAVDNSPSSKDDLRVELDMEPELPIVLLMGGGEGMGPVKKIEIALSASLFDNKQKNKPIGQLIIICGSNTSLAASLEAMEWNIPVKIRGFEKQMEKWMGACDCIITKGNPFFSFRAKLAEIGSGKA